jgi:hypothetical protein
MPDDEVASWLTFTQAVNHLSRQTTFTPTFRGFGGATKSRNEAMTGALIQL